MPVWVPIQSWNSQICFWFPRASKSWFCHILSYVASQIGRRTENMILKFQQTKSPNELNLILIFSKWALFSKKMPTSIFNWQYLFRLSEDVYFTKCTPFFMHPTAPRFEHYHLHYVALKFKIFKVFCLYWVFSCRVGPNSQKTNFVYSSKTTG